MPYTLTDEKADAVIERGARLLSNYCRRSGLHDLVTGSSGGIDSAIMLGFAQRACQMAGAEGGVLRSHALVMPCESTEGSRQLGLQAAAAFGAEVWDIDLTSVYQLLMGNTDPILRILQKYIHERSQLDEACSMLTARFSVLAPVMERAKARTEAFVGQVRTGDDWFWSMMIARGNVKARMRMAFGTYLLANLLRGMVLSTGNWDEMMQGFWTLHGDVGDFGVIQNVLKGIELPVIGQRLGIPREILEAVPDDGLGVMEGGDEAQLGAPYWVVSRVMSMLIKHGFDPDGPLDQLDRLPPDETFQIPYRESAMLSGVLSNYLEQGIVRRLAERCLRTSFKRTGSVSLTRNQLGLPSITDVAKMMAAG